MMAFRGTVTKPVSPDIEEGVKTFQKKNPTTTSSWRSRKNGQSFYCTTEHISFTGDTFFFSISKHVKVT